MTKQNKLLSLCFSILILAAAPLSFAAEQGNTPKAAGNEAATKIAAGRALFTGEMSLNKGGAPCIACHAFSYPGLTGGTLASDLTGAYEGMGGEQGMTEVLKSLSFPSMKAIYAERPLSDGEIEVLSAFFKDAGERKSGNGAGGIMTGGAALFALLIFALTLYKRRIG